MYDKVLLYIYIYIYRQDIKCISVKEWVVYSRKIINKKYHNIGTVPKSSSKIVETEAK